MANTTASEAVSIELSMSSHGPEHGESGSNQPAHSANFDPIEDGDEEEQPTEDASSWLTTAKPSDGTFSGSISEFSSSIQRAKSAASHASPDRA